MERRSTKVERNIEVGSAALEILQNLLDRMLGPRGLPNKRSINIHEVTERVRALLSADAPPYRTESLATKLRRWRIEPSRISW